MKLFFIPALCLAALAACTAPESSATTSERSAVDELSPEKRDSLVGVLRVMEENDKRNRAFLAAKTLDQALVDSLSQLEPAAYFTYTATRTSALTEGQVDSLQSIQRKLDRENTERLKAIVERFGWLSDGQLDSLVNPMIFLFHTPKSEIPAVDSLLYGEVIAGRMEPIKYATFVDNMRKKAYGQPQLYGTGDEFDAETKTIAPPYIENIDSTNAARAEIGLPPLGEGEYRSGV